MLSIYAKYELQLYTFLTNVTMYSIKMYYMFKMVELVDFDNLLVPKSSHQMI